MIGRIGFACKYMDNNEETVEELNTRTTTVAWLNRQTREVAEQRLWDIMQHNIAAAGRLVDTVGDECYNLRMVRLSSDILPVYTEPTWRYFWQLPDVRRYAETHFAVVGETARNKDVRVSFHPGQFTCLASESEDIVNRSIEEFEYHVDMARAMGFGKRFQDFKINVHIAGKKGPAGIISALSRLSPEARNCITIENDEISWGLDASLKLVDHLALVLDIHHNYIKTGEYIQANDDRIKRIVDSWRGVRPVIHYSLSRENGVIENNTEELPQLSVLLEQGYKKQKLRAHSDYMYNRAANEWALTHGAWADIMVEAKMKNLASRKLFKYWQSTQKLAA